MRHDSQVPPSGQPSPVQPATGGLQRSMRRTALAMVLAAAVASPLLIGEAQASDRQLNLYSARHYSSDNALYAEFTRQTGIQIQQIQAGDEAILERIRSEGKASPADVILLADAARLWKAQSEGLFQPAGSARLREAIPKGLQSDDLWFGLTTRARVIVYDKARIKPERVSSYMQLADPSMKGLLCTRSGTHPYMLSLLASIIEHHGEAKAEAWARGVVANLARTPRGGDTDQIKGVISGECAVALTNSYYHVRLLKSPKPDEREGAARLGYLWPDQSGTGTHVNVSGGGIARHAPHPEAARRFLEFLASPAAQAQLANANNEWPAVRNVAIDNQELKSLGTFKPEVLPVSTIGRHQAAAARIIDRSGWK
jgi:iron(III) transport system substrate-binding protein